MVGIITKSKRQRVFEEAKQAEREAMEKLHSKFTNRQGRPGEKEPYPFVDLSSERESLTEAIQARHKIRGTN